jgi:hypothetical protein
MNTENDKQVISHRAGMVAMSPPVTADAVSSPKLSARVGRSSETAGCSAV